MKISNKTKGTLLAQEAFVADKFFKRLKGLLGERGLKPGYALVLAPCNSIHTFFMRFAIDVIFADRNNRIIKIIPSLKPWRLTAIYSRAKYCVELPAGAISSSLSSLNDLLSFSD